VVRQFTARKIAVRHFPHGHLEPPRSIHKTSISNYFLDHHRRRIFKIIMKQVLPSEILRERLVERKFHRIRENAPFLNNKLWCNVLWERVRRLLRYCENIVTPKTRKNNEQWSTHLRQRVSLLIYFLYAHKFYISINSIFFTLYRIYNLRFTIYVLHFIIYVLQFTFYNLRFTIYVLQFTIYNLHLGFVNM